MFITLMKKQLMELWQTYYIDKKTGKARGKLSVTLILCLAAAVIGFLGISFFVMGKGMGSLLLGYGFDWLYFALSGLLSLFLGVFGSVFSTYGSLYLPRDNEQMLSLPIPVRTLLLVRVSGVFVTSLLFTGIVWVPVFIAYWTIIPVTVLNVLFPVLLTFILALFVTVLSCALGWVVALVALKTKGKSYMTVLLTLAGISLYYVVYFKVISSIEEITTHLNEVGDIVHSWLHYVYLLGNAAGGGVVPMIEIAVITLSLFAVCFFILSKTFMRLALAGNKESRRTKKIEKYEGKSVKSALIRREYRHFTSVATWMLNGGIGLVMMAVLSAVLIIKNSDMKLLTQLPVEFPTDLLPLIVLFVVLFLLSMVLLTPVSVSIEGKSLWIIQTLPVDAWEILKSKEKMAMQLMVPPALLLTVTGGYTVGVSALQMLFLCLSVFLYCFLLTDFGLLLNLKRPNMNWTNVAYLSKQSMPVTISMFGSWIFCGFMGFGSYLLTRFIPAEIILMIISAVLLILWVPVHRWVKGKGTEILRTL